MKYTTCPICQEKESSYKCPTCRIPYCSLVCYKSHKTTPCSQTNLKQVEGEKIKKVYDFPTEDTVEISKLEKLKSSDEVKNCLKNPHVKNIINTILKNDNPTDTFELAMQEPIFVELADACLKVIEDTDTRT